MTWSTTELSSQRAKGAPMPLLGGFTMTSPGGVGCARAHRVASSATNVTPLETDDEAAATASVETSTPVIERPGAVQARAKPPTPQ